MSNIAQKRGSFFPTMKIQRVSEFQPMLNLFSDQENFDNIFNRFLQSKLGKIYSVIPWEELVSEFELTESQLGRTSIFSPKGKIALMYLKNYAGVSDAKLIEQLNSNVDYQLFCDLNLGLNRLDNFKIVSEIRCDLASRLNIANVQNIFYNCWELDINPDGSLTMDATCYESDVRFPTNQKLLKESVDYLWNIINKLCSSCQLNLPRTKYPDWCKKYSKFSRKRRKSVKVKRQISRAYLRLLAKMKTYIEQILEDFDVELDKREKEKFNTIKVVYNQQLNLFQTGEKPKNRIVSIHKPYLRPIVRGKEIKQVEFGAKAHKVMVDGISFLEHLSFDNFNEGTRFQTSILKVQKMTKQKTRIVGADAIYATNANRSFATASAIQTDFVAKGRKSKHYKEQKILKSMITKERGSRLEGSFGKDKNHYYLGKIKARTARTEKLWIFFGIHLGNALEISRRKEIRKLKSA